MHKKRFGTLLASLRRERLEEGKPLSRAKFAEISGVEEEILSNIENGRKAVLPPDLLARLADGLGLTSGERKEFFLAASGADSYELYNRPDTPQTAINEALDVMEQMQQPAFLIDSYFDIIAANSMVLDLYRVTPNHFFDSKSDPATRFNLMRFLFDPEFEPQASMFGKHRQKFLAQAVMLFRASSLRYRAEPYFKCLRARLNKMEAFRKLYEQPFKHEHYVDNNLYVSLAHPQYGAVKTVSASIAEASSAGELKLVVLVPLDKVTASLYARLAEKSYILHAIEDWPQKKYQREACEKAPR